MHRSGANLGTRSSTSAHLPPTTPPPMPSAPAAPTSLHTGSVPGHLSAQLLPVLAPHRAGFRPAPTLSSEWLLLLLGSAQGSPESLPLTTPHPVPFLWSLFLSFLCTCPSKHAFEFHHYAFNYVMFIVPTVLRAPWGRASCLLPPPLDTQHMAQPWHLVQASADGGRGGGLVSPLSLVSLMP